MKKLFIACLVGIFALSFNGVSEASATPSHSPVEVFYHVEAIDASQLDSIDLGQLQSGDFSQLQSLDFINWEEINQHLQNYLNPGQQHQPTPSQEPNEETERSAEQEEPAQLEQKQEEEAAEVETDESQGLSADEQQMVTLVNQEREQQGLAPLEVDTQLVEVARVKAQDMIDNNYFGHHSPTYGSPFDMLNQFGVDYRTAGENLAGNHSVEGAHNGLMNSDGHRANILHSSYTKVGIGVVDGGPYGKMFVQLFKG